MDLKEDADLRSGILKCIDSGLGILGDVPKQIVYSYLARNDLGREMVLDEPWKFVETLKTLFGRGEEVLERTILMELKRMYGISSGVALVEVLAAMRLKKSPSSKHKESKERNFNPQKPSSRRMV